MLKGTVGVPQAVVHIKLAHPAFRFPDLVAQGDIRDVDEIWRHAEFRVFIDRKKVGLQRSDMPRKREVVLFRQLLTRKDEDGA